MSSAINLSLAIGVACVEALSHPIVTVQEALQSLLNRLAERFEIDLVAWKERFVTPLSPFPQEFFKAVEELNRRNRDAPLALVLLGSEDLNLLPILQIAKTHRLVVKTLHAGYLLGRTLRDTRQEQKKPIQMLCIAAPCMGKSVNLGEQGFWSPSPTLEISHLHEEDFAALDSNATIVLNKSGETFDFAEALEAVSKRSVCGLQYVAKGEEARSRLLSSAADTDDPTAQYKIGWCFDEGYGVDQSDDEAIAWYKRAAEQGHIKAMHKLGRIYDSQDRYEEALPWYLAAANEGHPKAQFEVGAYHALGRGGLSQSFQEAVRWYNLAAKGGHEGGKFWVDYYRKEGL